MSERAAFINAILDNPADDTAPDGGAVYRRF